MNKVLEHAIEELSRLPETEQEVVAERILEEVRRRTRPVEGRWAKVADELASSGLMRSQSAEFKRHVREFRDTFDFRLVPDD